MSLAAAASLVPGSASISIFERNGIFHFFFLFAYLLLSYFIDELVYFLGANISSIAFSSLSSSLVRSE